jgi:hypothetical protein
VSSFHDVPQAGVFQDSEVAMRKFTNHTLAVCLIAAISVIAYIWLKKEPQFRERAAPTRDVIRILNSEEGQRAQGGPVYICGFPLQHPWWFGDAISRFTPFSTDDVVLEDNCPACDGSLVLSWDTSQARYLAEFRNVRQPSNAVDLTARPQTRSQ